MASPERGLVIRCNQKDFRQMPLTDSAASAKDRRSAGTVSTLQTLQMLQHRHYAAIAGIIAAWPDTAYRDYAALRFADSLQVNPRFERARFLAACQPKD